MFVGAPFMVAKRWKQPECPSVDVRINKRWSIHPVEYYSAVKRVEALTHATPWENLENMPSKRRQTQKVACGTILLTWNVRDRYMHRDRKQIGGFGGWH